MSATGCPRCGSLRWGVSVGLNVCGCGHVWSDSPETELDLRTGFDPDARPPSTTRSDTPQ